LTLIIWAWSRSIVMFWSGLGLVNPSPSNSNIKLVVVVIIGISCYTTFSFSRSPARWNSYIDVPFVVVI